MADAPPEEIMSVFAAEYSLEVIEIFCQVEISQSGVPDGEFLITDKLFEILKFGSNLGKDFSSGGFPVRVSKQAAQFFENIFQNSTNILDFSLILEGLSQ
jgi:hypothetical protein